MWKPKIPINFITLHLFSKVVICFMMIRGRHRALPYALDRAIMLPSDRLTEDGSLEDYGGASDPTDKTLPLKKHHTS
ncbi:uncharacterized protein DNG_05866 [Cephalotrichum gorgonifer]|uniref:Uncharacterized protein n=1 Tax=Cephalotrichum gorgonifer TaxID=2041049 RepID=A0AAE8N0E6_9PEZI|nr:uncharacterized protein DNG_05866 [Cephalotrichum gorgonifer]